MELIKIEDELSIDELKEFSERKHRKIYKYLKKMFPDCVVKYNGVEGVDVNIQYKTNKIVLIEIKTCEKIVCNGIDHKKTQASNRPEIFNIHRLGRLKFSRRELYPYTVSQHDDLIKLDGWYLFFVGKHLGMHRILFGMKAEDVHLNPKKGLQQREWGLLSIQSSPSWFEQLKKEVYNG